MIRLARQVVCLDWDKRYLRIVVAQLQRGRARLLAAHRVRLPADVSSEDPAALGGFIAEQLKRHRCYQKQVLVDVPRDRAVINRLTVPPTPDGDLPDAVRLMAMKELPFPLDEAELDFVVLQRDEKGRATVVLLAAVLKKTLQRVQDTCTAAGIKPARVGLRPYANLVSVRQLAQLDPTRMLFVDVGASLTEIDIFNDGQLAFSRAASVEVPDPRGNASVTEDSRILTTADLDLAETRIQHAVEDLLVEMTRSLQAYRATDPQARVETVVIAGGTGVEPLLRDQAAERFGLDCKLFDPAAALRLTALEAERLRGFPAVLGLAWGLSRSGQLELDFLNPKRPIPRGQVQRQRLRTAVLAAAMLLVSGGGYAFYKYQQGAAALDLLRAELATEREIVKAKLEVQNQVDGIADWERSAVWPEALLAMTQSAVEPGKQMIVQQVRMDHRNATLELKQLQADRVDVASGFVSNINRTDSADPNETPDFAAQMGTWRKQENANRKFDGTTDIRVLLKDLASFLRELPKREKQRKEALRKL